MLSDFIGRTMKSLLVVEPDRQRRSHIVGCIASDDVQVTAVPDADAALQMLRERRIDCMVLNPQAADLADGIRVADVGRENGLSRLPVIVYGEAEPTDGGILETACGDLHRPPRPFAGSLARS